MIGSKKLVCLVCLLFHPTYIHPFGSSNEQFSSKCWLLNTPSGEEKSKAFIKEPGGKSF